MTSSKDLREAQIAIAEAWLKDKGIVRESVVLLHGTEVYFVGLLRVSQGIRAVVRSPEPDWKILHAVTQYSNLEPMP